MEDEDVWEMRKKFQGPVITAEWESRMEVILDRNILGEDQYLLKP